VASYPIKNSTTQQIKPEKLRRYVNNFLFPSLQIEGTISEPTSVRWLKKLGFTLARVQKGIYVEAHNVFINFLYHSVLP
jgi:hypothetical protein